jgi:CAAX protease family protein
MQTPETVLVGYFVLAFAIAWSGVLFADSAGGMFVAMVLGPSVASLTLTAASEGAHGLRELGSRALRWRVGARWYAMLGLAPGVLVVAIVTAGPGVTRGPLGLAVIGLVAGVFEELGWSGFATPRVLRRFGWFDAGLVLGIPWAIWHALPDYALTHNAYGTLWFPHMLEWLVALVGFRVLMTWVYSRTESVGLAMLLHASFTGSQVVLWPQTSPAAELVWYGTFACMLWVAVAIVIVLVERRVEATAR